MYKAGSLLIMLFLLIVINSEYILAAPLENRDDITATNMQQAFDQDQHDDFIFYKNKQNSLPDKKRGKTLFYNQYWLINKKQSLWLGIFDGGRATIPVGVKEHPVGKNFPRQQVIRIKKGGKTSQFLLSDEYGIKSPPKCSSMNNEVLKDTEDYLLFYSSCIFDTFQPKSPRHEGKVDILLYDKTYDNLMVVDNFPYSALEDGLPPLYYSQYINKLNGYYIDTSSEYKTAFKVIGEGQVISVDPETGKKEDLGVAPPILLKKIPAVSINQ